MHIQCVYSPYRYIQTTHSAHSPYIVTYSHIQRTHSPYAAHAHYGIQPMGGRAVSLACAMQTIYSVYTAHIYAYRTHTVHTTHI